MKVLLINPPDTASKYKFIGLVAPPLGISYIAAVLEENGIDVRIIDGSALEMTWKELEKDIQKYSPDIIAVTALTPTIIQALKTARIAKSVCPDAYIVLGGYHPTFTHNELLKNEFIDIIVCGEGEYTMLELAEAIENGGDLREVKGIATREFRTPPRPIIKDLDELPFPARHLLPMDKYKILNIKLPTGTLISGRGCPHHCSFCSSSAMHGHKLRSRSSKNVVDEMEHLIDVHNSKMIAFMDDTFTMNRKKVEEVCNDIKERDLDVYWGCTARVDTLSTKILEQMRDAGCITLFLGVESGDQQNLDNLNKNVTIDRIKTTFELTKKLGVRTIASAVLGMPGDTRQSIEKTINFVKTLNPSYAIFSLATPYPGTDFYMNASKQNLIRVDDWSKYTLLTPVLETVDCSLDELKELQRKAFRNFYLRPDYIIRQAWTDGFIIIKTVAAIIRDVGR
ncbi:MAG: cobalamin B12-binding domain-containing protein [Methanobacterium sp.]|uniref:B12-binding domain-containing radical SAM protein n=1 Tax=Methanobacterium sp. TaxID=2164 RepID=UPI003D65AB68|nr:cobalamin B12-binding domain-containing protein [Methanobacterium sp.]